MTQEEMYEHVRAQMRKGVTALQAINETLTIAGSQVLPFNKAHEHLYVRCDTMPPHSIKTIDFIVDANFLKWEIVAFCKRPVVKEVIAVPYIHIYKEKGITNENIKKSIQQLQGPSGNIFVEYFETIKGLEHDMLEDILFEFYETMKSLENDPNRGSKQATKIVMTINDIEKLYQESQNLYQEREGGNK